MDEASKRQVKCVGGDGQGKKLAAGSKRPTKASFHGHGPCFQRPARLELDQCAGAGDGGARVGNVTGLTGGLLICSLLPA